MIQIDCRGRGWVGLCGAGALARERLITWLKPASVAARMAAVNRCATERYPKVRRFHFFNSVGQLDTTFNGAVPSS
jgi:hypothetical protein